MVLMSYFSNEKMIANAFSKKLEKFYFQKFAKIMGVIKSDWYCRKYWNCETVAEVFPPFFDLLRDLDTALSNRQTIH